MSINICILDYKSGNVGSVYNMIKYMGYDCHISNEEKYLESATHIIMPGVGSFKNSMKKISSNIPIKKLEKEVLIKKKPFLGICVGMQVLAEKGNEFGAEKGLGWIKGEVNILKTDKLPLPHVCWNDIEVNHKSELTRNLESINDFYFVHSYKFDVESENEINAYTTYGEKFCSILNKENIFGVQVHPEKSQKSGMILINNFLNLKNN
jgi:glutamine amidotransferase